MTDNDVCCMTVLFVGVAEMRWQDAEPFHPHQTRPDVTQ